MERIDLFMKDEIIMRLKDMRGERVALYNLGYILFENEDISGSFECNSHAAIKWIKRYFEELDEIVEDYLLEFGELPNPILEPEKFQLIIILHLSYKMINKALYNADLVEDEEIELTEDVLDKIIEVL